jgi:hypothetical protein
MPDPISPSVSNGWEPDPSLDLSLDDMGQQCRGDAANRSEPLPQSSTSPAVTQLVSAVSRPATAPSLPAATSPSVSSANNNAQRTTERSGIAPYAAAGKIAAGDSLYVGVAGLKGRDPKSGLEVEVLSASEQKGLQLESQAALVRLGQAKAAGSFNIEAFTLRATHGIHNDDGSTGYNIGALATALGGEVTLNHGADSLTLGLSAGVGAAGSVGLRDIDGDGEHEVCVKASIAEFTLGACVETPL